MSAVRRLTSFCINSWILFSSASPVKPSSVKIFRICRMNTSPVTGTAPSRTVPTAEYLPAIFSAASSRLHRCRLPQMNVEISAGVVLSVMSTRATGGAFAARMICSGVNLASCAAYLALWAAILSKICSQPEARSSFPVRGGFLGIGVILRHQASVRRRSSIPQAALPLGVPPLCLFRKSASKFALQPMGYL